PTLFTLITASSTPILTKHRCIRTFRYVVKELASRILVAQKKVFTELANEIFSPVAQLVLMGLDEYIKNSDDTYTYLNVFDFIKIVKNLSLHNSEIFSNSHFIQFYPLFFDKYVNLINSSESDNTISLLKLCSKFILNL